MQNATTAVLLLLVLITGLAAVAANLGLWGLDPESNFAKVTLGAVLIEAFAAVLMAWKARANYPGNVITRIKFPAGADPHEISLDLDKCFYEIRSSSNGVKRGKPSLVFGNSGWECRVPTPSGVEEAVTITLFERSDRMWEVRPFYPLARDVDARPYEQGGQ